MSNVLMTLVMPNQLAQEIEDLLLSRPDLVKGFTATQAEGHGASVELVEAGELVAGHVPRTVIRSAGSETDMRAVIALIKAELPRANLYFWLVPVIEMGRL
jgi:hypothetical protein